MAALKNNSTLLICDVSLEQNFRDFIAAIRAKYLAMGLTRASDSGQINIDTAYLRATSTDNSSPTTYKAAAAMDGNTTLSNGWRSAAAPSLGSPQDLIYDAGLGNTFTPLSTRIFTNTQTYDPKDIVLSYTDSYDPLNPGAATWTDFLTTSLASNTGNNNQNVTPGAHRFFRLRTTSTQGVSSYVQIAEWELWTAINGGGTKATLATPLAPSAGGTAVGYDIWNWNDWHNTNAPCKLKQEYGSGSATSAPALWITLTPATDGAGNITDIRATQRQQFAASSGGNVNTAYKTVWYGEQVATTQLLSKGRLFMALFTNYSSGFMWIAIDRNKNSDGTDKIYNDVDSVTGAKNAGMHFFGQSGFSTQSQGVMPVYGPSPTNETSHNLSLSTTQTMIRGARTGLQKFAPLLGPELMPALIVQGYCNADITAELEITDTIYGNPHKYYPLGNQITGVGKSAPSYGRVACLWDD